MSIGTLSPCSAEAFRERLQTSAIRRAQEEARYTSRSGKKSDPEKCKVMRRIDDIKLAKSLGLSIDELE